MAPPTPSTAVIVSTTTVTAGTALPTQVPSRACITWRWTSKVSQPEHLSTVNQPQTTPSQSVLALDGLLKKGYRSAARSDTEREYTMAADKTPGTYRYRVVDVFTQQPLEGNPLAVFPDAAGLDDLT